MTVAVVAHPGKVGPRGREDLVALMQRLGEPEPLWFQTTVDETGERQGREAIAAGAQVVLAWGGDGTVLGVAAALAHTPTPLGILPGGTGNLLARNMGIPLTFEAAVETALRGADRRIDLLDVYLGRGDRRLSAVMCGMGLDADMMAAPEEMKRRLGWLAYLVEGARRFRHKGMRLRLSVDGGPELHLEGALVLVANVGKIVAGMDLLPESEPDDGRLEVLVIDPSTPLDYVRTSAGIVTGLGTAADPSRTVLTGRSVTVSTNHARERQIDGDLVSPGYGFRVRVLPQALTVRTPIGGPDARPSGLALALPNPFEQFFADLRGS